MPKIGAAPEIEDLPRRPGPMAVAGRDAGEAVTRVLEEQAEQRRRNADDADAWRAAEAEGRVLLSIPLDAVRTDSLPRDRMALEAVATDDAMEELKASLRARGQREPIAVFPAGQGVWQLKTGWRRLEALRQLHAETGAARFATVLARVDHAIADRAGLYVGMVEENAVRENVSFAEMAQVAIAMARDPHTAASNPDEAVSTLYGALHKAKRSAIRRFVDLLTADGRRPARTAGDPQKSRRRRRAAARGGAASGGGAARAAGDRRGCGGAERRPAEFRCGGGDRREGWDAFAARAFAVTHRVPPRRSRCLGPRRCADHPVGGRFHRHSPRPARGRDRGVPRASRRIGFPAGNPPRATDARRRIAVDARVVGRTGLGVASASGRRVG
jgi:hypothetical protein